MADDSSFDAESTSNKAVEEEELPPSVALPTRPIFWGRVAYPLAAPLEIVEAGGAYTPGALLKVTWKLIFCSFMASIYGKIDGDIWSPYLFSRVHCCDKDGNSANTPKFPVENAERLWDLPRCFARKLNVREHC